MLAPYFRDMALWPVAIVLLAHVVLGIAVATLSAWRSGLGHGFFASALLLALSLASWLRDLRRLRFGITSRVLLGSWLAGIACAIAASRYGIY